MIPPFKKMAGQASRLRGFMNMHIASVKMTLAEIQTAINELSADERKRLFREFHIETGEVDPKIEKANLAEIKMRIEMADRGDAVWLDGKTALKEIESELNVKFVLESIVKNKKHKQLAV